MSFSSGLGSLFTTFFFFSTSSFKLSFAPNFNLYLWWALPDSIADDQAGLEPQQAF